MKTIKNIFMLGVVAMSLLLGSCNKEGLTDGELAPGTVQVQLVVLTAQPEKTATRATSDGTVQENFVGKVQMLFWNVDKAKVERYIAIDPSRPVIDNATTWNPDTGILTLRDVNSTDPIVIYVMANGKGDELAGDFATKDAILQTIAEHSGAITDIATTPLPMSGISAETTFAADNSTKVTVELRRMVAKVNITVALGADFLVAYPDLKFGKTAAGEAATLELINTVDRSYVFSKTPVTMPTDAKFGISSLLVAESGVAQAMTWKATAYVFENPTPDKDGSMKIALNMPYKDGTSEAVTKNSYQVEINHTATANRVVRNHIYDVTMTINGFGKEKITVNTLVAPWNVKNIDIPVAGEYVRIKSIKADATDLAANPDYKWNRNGDTITVVLAANVVGTKFEFFDADGKQLATATHSNIADKIITLVLPINFGVEDGTNVNARDCKLRITNPTTKMHYNSTVTNKIEITHRQGAIVWAKKNIGAGTPEQGGNIYQYDRNHVFEQFQNISAPWFMLNKQLAPVSVADAEGKYAAVYINAENSDIGHDRRTWASDPGIQNKWANPTTNPCYTSYNNNDTQRWRVPTKYDFDALILQKQGDFTKLQGKAGHYFGMNNNDKIFMPMSGLIYHVLGNLTNPDVEVCYWSTTTIAGNGQVHGHVYVFRLMPTADPKLLIYTGVMLYGNPLRCVKYID